MFHLLWVTRTTFTMAVGKPGVFTASRSSLCGSAGAARYLVAGRGIKVSWRAVCFAARDLTSLFLHWPRWCLRVPDVLASRGVVWVLIG